MFVLSSTAPDTKDVQYKMKQNDRHESLGLAPENIEYLAPGYEDCTSKKVYKSPVVPNMNIFDIEVTGVGDGGIIYGMPLSSSK